jgi:uncharacterized protein (TIGR00369 family)
MGNKGLDLKGMRTLRGEAFAPMVQQLEIEPVEITADGARFEIPAGEFVMRTGEIVCGQAIASIADTIGVMTLFAHNEEPRIMTTVDMTTHFMRPLARGMIEAQAFILSNGRRMATVRIEIKQQGSEKIAGTTTCAYVYV